MAVESNPNTGTTRTEGLRLAERLRSVCVGARRDLKVTRHLFRGEPAYLISDPMTLQNHRLGPDEYAVFVSLRRDRTLGQLFQERVSRGEEITITRHEKPVARLVPVQRSSLADIHQAFRQMDRIRLRTRRQSASRAKLSYRQLIEEGRR